MTNFYKQVFVSPNENVSAGDIGLLSAFDCQNSKNFNKYIISLNDCVISGLQVIAPSSGGSTVTVQSGYAIYASPTATTTIQYSNPSITLSYQGAIVEIDSSVGISITTPDPTNIRYDAIDLIYTEYQAIPATRNFIDPGTGIVSPQSTNVETVSNTVSNPGSPNTNIVYTQGIPGAGFPAIPTNCIRLAIIQVNPSGIGHYNITQANITQSGSTGTTGSGGTLPRIFDLQNFPTNSNAVNGGAINTSDQSNSLSDSLSAIRYQLNQIITTGNSNWYAQIPISLPQLLIWAGTDTGIANAYVVSIANFPTTLIPGLRILYIASNPNTGASTVSVNGGTGIAIKDALGNDIQASSIQAGQRVLLFYDGTYWIMPYLNVGISEQSPFEIPNGSFEVWNGATPQQWTLPILTGNAVVSQDTANSIDGTSALKIAIPASDIGTATTTSPLVPCSQQNSYYIKFKTYSNGTNINASISINFYDSTKSLIQSSNLWAVTGTPVSSWTTYYGIVLDYNAGSLVAPSGILTPHMPNNTRYFSVTVTGGISSSTISETDIWFDGIQIFYPGTSSVIWTSSANGTYNFVTPGNCVELVAHLVSAGGGGGRSNSPSFAGGGGGSGAYSKLKIFVNPDTSYSITVGLGGSPAPIDNSGGGNGGNTSFGPFAVSGGSGGPGASGSPPANGGSGGFGIPRLPTVTSGAIVLATYNGNQGSGGSSGTGGFVQSGNEDPFTPGGGGSGKIGGSGQNAGAGGQYGGGGGACSGGNNAGGGANGFILLEF